MARILSETEAERLIKLYSDAEIEILKEYNKALLKGNDLKNLAALKRNIGIIRRDLLNGGRTWCEQAIPTLYTSALAEVDDVLGSTDVGFGSIHQQAMQVLAENAYQRLMDVDQVIGRRADDVYRNLALEAIRGDVAGYQTWKQTAKIYREKLAEKGVTGIVGAAGREWNIRTYSEIVARTTTRETMIQGTANRLLERGHDLAEIVGGTAKNTCQICRSWVGRVVSLTGRTPGYPTLDEARAAGLFHANCTHNIAIAGSFEEEIAKARGS
jgi:hypothetical protein